MLHHIYYGLLLTWLSTYFDSTGVLVPESLSSSLYWPIALRKKALYFILQVRTHFWKACWRTKLKHVTDSLLRGWVNSESIFRAGCCVNKLACEKFLIVAWIGVQQISELINMVISVSSEHMSWYIFLWISISKINSNHPFWTELQAPCLLIIGTVCLLRVQASSLSVTAHIFMF